MKIICLEKNYPNPVDDVEETLSSEPYFFFKPDSALSIKNRPFFLPDFSSEIHCEIELIVRICKLGKHIEKKFAHTYYDAIGLGVDISAKDILKQCQIKGLPWEMATGFDGTAVVSDFIEKENFKKLHSLNFSLSINGETIQRGDSKQMILGIEDIIVYISQYITLKIGDIIFTGTPVKSKKVAINDHLEGFLENEKIVDFNIK